jgi:serine/threonine-protein kinase RsbW
MLMFSSPQVPCWDESPDSIQAPEGREAHRLHGVAEIEPLLTVLGQDMAAVGYSEKEQFGVRLALDEALVNGIKHGNRGDPGKWVAFRYLVTPVMVLAEVEDQGPGFDPEHVPDPLAPENLERASGRGLLLMRSYMTWVRYSERGNRVTLCKYRTLP